MAGESVVGGLFFYFSSVLLQDILGVVMNFSKVVHFIGFLSQKERSVLYDNDGLL